MSFLNRSIPYVAALLALAANACSATPARPVVAAHAPVKCAGGSIASAADAALYSECDIVRGSLRISAPDLMDLSSLARLRGVWGTLEIAENPQLDDLSGLEQLSQVGALVVRDNADLDDLHGLENLNRAPSVTITSNPELATLHGLSGLSRADHVVIRQNGLFNVGGLSSLAQVGELEVTSNLRLNSLQGLRSLEHADSVKIEGNPRLCAMGMLPALRRVDEQLTLRSNRGLSKTDVRALLGRIEQPLVNVAGQEAETTL